MEQNFGEQLLNYLANSTDLSTLDGSVSAINSLVDAADARTRISLLPKLEEAAAKLKEQESTAAGLAKPAGWAPLAQVLAAVIQSQNLARQERAFAVLVQLISFTPSGAAGLVEEAGNLAALTLAALGTGGQRKSCDEVRDEHFEQEMKQSIQSAREAALHALKTLLSKFPVELPPKLEQLFPELQAALLAILPDKSSEPMRQLSVDCMEMLVKFHRDPASLFSLLSDMSAECGLMLKDDPLLDHLLEKALGRENELNEKQNGGGGTSSG